VLALPEPGGWHELVRSCASNGCSHLLGQASNGAAVAVRSVDTTAGGPASASVLDNSAVCALCVPLRGDAHACIHE
jgi:hypothetical protein